MIALTIPDAWLSLFCAVIAEIAVVLGSYTLGYEDARKRYQRRD